ncbi:alkene reductase [Longimicrobium sp.]|uniref:alkene reductase n=1 Tax=Longimicrobium sp. TaxID=2029185 RepID=UPI002E37CA09|nr:alkene reductase [Longimicrobium sp.]HEX6042779.1 alkene reductase [Longimicrobium sp.]
MAEDRGPNLFTPYRLGPYELRNRVVMAPMTRSRAGEGNVPTPLMAEYYTQRAGAGLLVTEGSQVAPEGVGYPDTPGIHTDAQERGWRAITDAVHARGGRIFLQLWHVGRVSHPGLQPGGALPVAPSAIGIAGEMLYTAAGPVPFVTPRALGTDEIAGIVEQYADGARRAYRAGFDGVELHGANGYLIDQFLRDGSNHRTDRYGGSPENRARFLAEVTGAVVDVWGGQRVGVRVSPTGTYNGMRDSDPVSTFSTAAHVLNRFGLAYLHVVEPVTEQASGGRITPVLKAVFRGPVMANGGYDAETGNAAIASGRAELVSFGTAFLANPDLPERLRTGAPLNAPDRATFYGGGAHGYTDYPVLETANAA